VLRLGIFLAPLAFLPHLVDQFVLPKLILARLLVMVLTALLLFGWARQGAITWKRTPLDLPLLAFVSSAALSTVFAINSNVAIFGTYGRWEGLLTITNYALLFWLAIQFTSGESDSRALTWSLLISGYIIAVAAVLQAGFGLLGGGYFKSSEGFIRADVTLANPDFLGIFLALLLPIAFGKLISQRPFMTRLLAANLVVVFVLALILTYARGAWIGALIGSTFVLSYRRGQFHAWSVIATAAVVVIAIGLLGLTASRFEGSQALRAAYARVLSIPDLSRGSEAQRIRVSEDSLALVASRPILGYGPDTFGLVYPKFQTVDWQGTLWDRPHEETLGIAATQGVFGVIAYAWLIVGFVRAFWAGRLRRGAVVLFSGWLAYQIGTQFNFSYIPTSVPFWLLAAGTIVTWEPNLQVVRVASYPNHIAYPVLAAGSLALATLAIIGSAFPYIADADYRSALIARDASRGRPHVAHARMLAPYESTYAAAAGDLALDLDSNDNPSPDANWISAYEAYTTAAELGGYAPETFRHLAVTDEHLGNHAGAVAAARRAVELDRYDPDSQALLAKLTS
jgi:putative inorganic carbon (HCO3(-)) transporter